MMNVEDLKKNLRELQSKQRENLKKRKGLIKDLKTLPYQTQIRFQSKKLKLNDGNELTHQFQEDLGLNLEGCKEERIEKQKELNAKTTQESKQRDRRIFGNVLGHLQRAKKVLDQQETKLQKQLDITKRMSEKDKKEFEELRIDSHKRRQVIQTEWREIDKELAQDDFKRQVHNEFKRMFIVTNVVDSVCYNARLFHYKVKINKIFQKNYRSVPHILWKPGKMNEGLSTLKKESEQTIREMENVLKEKLQNAFRKFQENQTSRFQEREQLIQENPDHNITSQSETEESESQPQEPEIQEKLVPEVAPTQPGQE